MSSFTTVPGVLIAMPQLHDPNFHRAVVVMIEHDAQGALGLVVNQAMPRACQEVTESFGLGWPGSGDARLLRGGPVEPQSLWMLHDDGWCFDETMRVTDGVSVSRSREALTRMCEGGEPHLCLLVGFAGWGPGQLEAEIAAGTWLHGALTPELVFDWPREEVWLRTLAMLGVNPAFLVEDSGSAH